MNYQHYLQELLNQKRTRLVEKYTWDELEERVYDLSENIFNAWLKNILRWRILFLQITFSIAKNIYVI